MNVPEIRSRLRYPARPAEQLLHFCYEADRGSMPMADMLKKYRTYYYFIKRRQKHKESFGVHPEETTALALFFAASTDSQRVPAYLLRPDLVFDRLWALPDRTMHALDDTQNSPQ